MSDNAIDILSEDLSGVDTSTPLLAEGTYDVRVKEIKKVQAKDGVNHNLKIQLALVDKARSVDGELLNAGFPIFDQISLKVTENYDPRKNLRRFQEAAGVNGPFEPLSQYQDKVLRVQVKVAPESKNKDTGETYPPKNQVKNYVKV